MNVNFNLKDILVYFKRTSFRISFLIGISLYKFWLLDTKNTIIINIVNIIFVLAVIFLLDDIVERIINCIDKKGGVKKCIKGLKQMSDPQVLILISHYFDYNKGVIDINSTSYFSLQDGEYQVLKSKLIVFQATNMSDSFDFPFTLQEWAYKELTRAVVTGEISFEETENEYIIHWYKRKIKYEKNFLNEYRESNDQHDLY